MNIIKVNRVAYVARGAAEEKLQRVGAGPRRHSVKVVFDNRIHKPVGGCNNYVLMVGDIENNSKKNRQKKA